MPIWGWVCVGFVALCIVVAIVDAVRKAQTTSKVMSEGVTVVAHIIAADERLYAPLKPGTATEYASANIVFALDATLSDERYARLESYAEALRGYTPAGPDPAERELASLKKAYARLSEPARLPDTLTGGEEVYVASVDVSWNLLDCGRLARPYIHCKSLVGPGGAVRMVASPPADWVPRPVAPSEASSGAPRAVPSHAKAALVATARAAYAGGYSRKYARKKLLESGATEADVDTIVEDAWLGYTAEQRRTGGVQAVVGGLMLAVGIGITVAVAQRVAAEGGGTYVVMTGLILAGAWNLFRGSIRAIGGR